MFNMTSSLSPTVPETHRGSRKHPFKPLKLRLAFLFWKLEANQPWRDLAVRGLYPVPWHGLVWRMTYRTVALLCCDVQTSPGHVTRQQKLSEHSFHPQWIFEERSGVQVGSQTILLPMLRAAVQEAKAQVVPRHPQGQKGPTVRKPTERDESPSKVLRGDQNFCALARPVSEGRSSCIRTVPARTAAVHELKYFLTAW